MPNFFTSYSSSISSKAWNRRLRAKLTSRNSAWAVWEHRYFPSSFFSRSPLLHSFLVLSQTIFGFRSRSFMRSAKPSVRSLFWNSLFIMWSLVMFERASKKSEKRSNSVSNAFNSFSSVSFCQLSASRGISHMILSSFVSSNLNFVLWRLFITCW